MTSARFASLNASMMERSSIRTDHHVGTAPKAEAVAGRANGGAELVHSKSFNSSRRAFVDPGPTADLEIMVKDAGRRNGQLAAPSPTSRPSPWRPVPALTMVAPAKAVSPTKVSKGVTRKTMTVRLGHESHRRLRLAGAQFNRTYQEILHTAMDEYLTRLGFPVAT